jgi:hypothetical protein
MTKLLIVCLGVVLSWPAPQAFSLAEQIGDPPRAYFRFSTSAGNYTVRYDGFVEVYIPNDSNYLRKRVFFLKTTGRARLERVYFLEHEGDLLLRYDVIGQGSCFTRIEQRKRTARWFTPLNKILAEEPVINGNSVIVGDTEISKVDGKILRQD